MSKAPNNKQMTGMFQFTENQRLPGTLSLDGKDTTLHLWDEAKVRKDELHEKTITGVLGDQKLVTLLGCILNNSRTNFGRRGTANHYYVFPHYVVIGDRLISEDDADIANISFVFEDAPALFRDVESFRIHLGNVEETRTIIGSLNPGKTSHVGDFSCVAYYTGREELFSSDTDLGRISVRHSPSFNLGGPEGIHIDNKIITKIDFPEPLVFQDAMLRMYRLVTFFGLIVGRLQDLTEISISWRGDDLPLSCDVYATMYPRQEHSTSGFGSSFHDVLVDGARNASLLSSVVRGWMQRDASWRIARAMLFSGWEDIRSYSADRLVRAANMYDLLPESCFPTVPQIDGALALSVRKARQMFRALPNGADRNSVLGALGRVGTLTLKKKINFRVDVVSKLIGERVPNIERVAEEAVNLRNRYVHGSTMRHDCGKEPDLEIFLTDTLEFVFAASDLVDAGWNIRDWSMRGPHGHHPFGNYLESYPMNWKKLKRFMDEG